MSSSLLSKLRSVSILTPETADLAVIGRLAPDHVVLSSARVTAAAQAPEHADLVDAAVRWAQKKVGKGGIRKLVAMHAVQRLPLEFTRRIVESTGARVSFEIDGRLAHKRRQIIERAREIVAELEELGIGKDRVLLKVPATWDAIEAARKLAEKDGIKCHLTLVFGMHQLAAAADAGVGVVAPCVGRITDWHKKNDGVEGYAPVDDPGIRTVAAMHRYLHDHGYTTTKLAPYTFRALDQPLALAGIDMIALPMALIDDLDAREGELTEHLPGAGALGKLTLEKSSFDSMHMADAVASSKLSAGIQNLSWGVIAQEKQLADWIVARQDRAAETSTQRLFSTWDFDGDGYIDREEWAGTDEVFKALDRDNNGRISLEEMAKGLGAPYRPEG